MQRRAHARFAAKDVAEIAVGACVMAFPVSVTEEVWNLGVELSLQRALFFALASLCFLALFIYLLQYRREEPTNTKVLLRRVLSTYGLTLIIAALLLLGVDRLDVLGDPAVSLKRVILVAFPASFAATVVDSIGS